MGTGIGGFLQEFLYGYPGLRWSATAVDLAPSLTAQLGGVVLHDLTWHGRVFTVAVGPHTSGPGQLSIWATPKEVICQVHDSGHISSAARHGPLAQPGPIQTTRSELYGEGALARPPSPRCASSAAGRSLSSTMPCGPITNLRTVGSWRLARVLMTAIVRLIVSRSRW